MLRTYQPKKLKGGNFNAENLPAEENPQKERTWFQKKNVYFQRTQGACKKES